jgi:hypothetical protein
MNLVKITSSSYINMDKIESVFEDVKKSTYGTAIIKRVRCVSGETYEVSEEAYETILVYGKAKIQ